VVAPTTYCPGRVWKCVLGQKLTAKDHKFHEKRVDENTPHPDTRELSWHTTEDVDHPWTTEVAGQTWRVALNDFPDDFMYTLIIDDAIIGKFHEWPETWQR
jgi:hypothetical protein